jgi:uncharacterized protein (DUF983 family)
MGFSLKAMWNYKCPKCHQGDMFKSPLELSNPLNMNDCCETCGQKFEPEPGFYYGAMFLSYILSAWFFLLPTLLLIFYFDWSLNQAMAFTIGLGIITFLRFLRGSRALWLHLMVGFNMVK